MVKTIELVVVAVLLAFSFFAGVKYSESVKEHAGWLFEVREVEEEVELPDLSGEGVVETPSNETLESDPANGNSEGVVEENSTPEKL
jgi:hypothetical protein